MPEVTTISALARKNNIAPRKISDLFYARKLDESVCPLIAGRRLIPLTYVPVIEAILRASGVIAVAVISAGEQVAHA